MRVLAVVAQIVGYAVLLAGAYFAVVYAAAGAVVWAWRQWKGPRQVHVGTFCPTCRTVYRWPQLVRIACDGDYRAPRHGLTPCEVVRTHL